MRGAYAGIVVALAINARAVVNVRPDRPVE
jgi:hypothetical protein